MKIKILFYTLTVIMLFLGSCSQTTQKNKTFKGTIDNHFHLSSTNKIKPEDRPELEKDIDTYLSKMDLLNSYYEKINTGATQSAEQVLKTDTILSKQDDFQLAYMFSLAKMKELGVLYKPSFQVNDNSVEIKLIFCTDEQINDLTEKQDKVFELNCKYIGDLIIDKTQVYQLENYK